MADISSADMDLTKDRPLVVRRRKENIYGDDPFIQMMHLTLKSNQKLLEDADGCDIR